MGLRFLSSIKSFNCKELRSASRIATYSAHSAATAATAAIISATTVTSNVFQATCNPSRARGSGMEGGGVLTTITLSGAGSLAASRSIDLGSSGHGYVHAYDVICRGLAWLDEQ